MTPLTTWPCSTQGSRSPMAIKFMQFHNPLRIVSSTTPNSKHSLVTPCYTIKLLTYTIETYAPQTDYWAGRFWAKLLTHTHAHGNYSQTPYIGPRSSSSLGPFCDSKSDDFPLQFIMIKHSLPIIIDISNGSSLKLLQKHSLLDQ